MEGVNHKRIAFATMLNQTGRIPEKELRAAIADPKISDREKEKLIDELTKRLESKIKDGKGTTDDQAQLLLLPKLKEGTLNSAQTSELEKLMGVNLPDPKPVGENLHI